MKFVFKLIISIIAIISVIFSTSGIILINKNFKHSLDVTINQNIEGHLLEKYGIEDNVVNNITEDGEIFKDSIIQYAKGLEYYFRDVKSFAIYVDNEEIYRAANLEINTENMEYLLNANDVKYVLKHVDDNNYILISSSVIINGKVITLLSIYDITDVFVEKDRQLTDFLKVDIGVIIVSIIAIYMLSMYLTKPIRDLSEISNEISKGVYNRRVKVKTNDEIGLLSNNFNMMAATIENKIKELELSVKQREEFISNFTHELKNPMTAIIGFTDLIKSNKYSKENKEKAAEYIFSEAKKLEILARKLMDLIGLSNESIKFENVDIILFSKQLAESMNNNSDDIKIELDMENEVVKCDGSLLEVCLKNLLDNAKKSNPKDNKVVLFGKREGDKYKISVIDKGCGISEKDLPRITESFYMVDKARAKSDGRNGIGLSICEKIANIHNSKLVFESEVGEGTTVSFLLEVCKDED